MKLTALNDLIAEHGAQAVIEALSDNLKNKESVIRETHDETLGTAFDYLVTTLVEFYPLLPLRKFEMIKLTLLSKPVLASMRIRKADSEMQSPAMREADKFIRRLQQ